MKIYAFIQMYNEEITGHLKRCLDNCKQWADDIIIYDDKSTDNSVEIAKQYTKNIILGEKNEWRKETFHKQTMLEYIHNMKEKPDWILWLDCDEIVDRNCINNLHKFCEKNNDTNIDAFSFQQINLWRGERYYRTDGPLYGDNFNVTGWFVRLWKYNLDLVMLQKIGADQRLYPINIKNIQPCTFKVIHYGFSNYKLLLRHIGVHSSTKEKLIEYANGEIYLKLAQDGVEWAKTYVINGKGIPNMFLNEENLTVKYCENNIFPLNNIPHEYYKEPIPFPISELKVFHEIPSILFLGNCQINVIKDYCRYYLKYDIDYLNIVYDLQNQNNRVDFLIKNASIIVTQPFYKGYYYDHDKINELKDINCKTIVVHCLYYDGYFPQKNILNYYEKEKNSELSNNIIELSNKSLMNLYERENGLKNYIKINIPIHDFIQKNLQKRRLFLRHNHPCNYLMNRYSYLICKEVIKEDNFFKNNILNYNDEFDNLPEKLNSIETYTEIDKFTYDVLYLQF